MFEQIKTPWIAFLLMVAVWTSGCARVHYVIHPGALNQMDSMAYDALLIAQTTIDQARVDYQGGKLPIRAKDALETLIAAYNVARLSWLTYRDAAKTNGPAQPDADRLSRSISDLMQAVRLLKEGR